MTVCKHCKNDMSGADTCWWNDFIEYPDGTKLPSLSYHFKEPNGRCHDCGIRHGGKHHPGCDVERCPTCLGQLISCGCFDEKEVNDG